MKKTNISINDSQHPERYKLQELLDYYMFERFDEAEKLAISITRKFEKHPFAWKVLGALLNKTGRISEALIACEKSVLLDPSNPEAHNNLGNTLQKLGRLQDAQASYKQSIALRRDYAESHNNLGNTLHQLGKYEEAVISFMKAISLNNNYYQAHFNLGNSLQKLNKIDEAESEYKKAIALKSDYLMAYNNLGLILKDKGKLDEAESYLIQAIQIKPEFAELHNNIGNVFKRLGKLNDAEEAFRTSIKLEPDNFQSIFNLSTLLNQMNRGSQSRQLLEKNLKKFNGNFALMAMVELAISSFLNDDLIKSKKYLSESKELEKMINIELKNYHVYWNYLNKLIYENNPRITRKNNSNSIKQIFVIGESHSLVSHRLNIRFMDDDFECKSILTKGCKQWDLASNKRNHYKFKFESIFKELEKSSWILLAIGEIDCRLDSGIMKHKKKFPKKKTKDIINHTIDNYLNYLQNINSKYEHNIVIQGVPCPNIKTRNISKSNKLELIKLIKDFNIALRKKSIKNGFSFLDVYKLTDRGDGFSNQKWHIDQYHLNTYGMQKAWQKYYLT